MMRKDIAPYYISMCIILFCSITAHALVIPTVYLEWSGQGGGDWMSSYTEADVTVNGDDLFCVEDVWSSMGCDVNWDIMYDSDPYVISSISVTNNMSSTQTFTLTVTVPVSPQILVDTYYGGDMSGSFTTDPEGGTLSTAAPDPLYLGMIDGAGVLGLHSDPSSWVRTFGGTTPIPYAMAGLPLGSLINGPVVTSIGIQHTFTLTQKDTVVISGYFEVEAIPEPATIALLGIGGLFLMRRRR